jgi:hypothetical protein
VDDLTALEQASDDRLGEIAIVVSLPTRRPSTSVRSSSNQR